MKSIRQKSYVIVPSHARQLGLHPYLYPGKGCCLQLSNLPKDLDDGPLHKLSQYIFVDAFCLGCVLNLHASTFCDRDSAWVLEDHEISRS